MINKLRKLFKNSDKNTIDSKYYEEFNKVKYELCKLVPEYKKEVIDTFPLNVKEKELQKEDTDKLNYCNAFILNKLNLNTNKGLCSYLCNLNIEAFMILLEEEIAFLTVGKILVEDKNVFNIPEKEVVINKLISDSNEFKNVLMGGNLHLWITLGNGMIIDPSIKLSINDINEVVIGSPSNICKNSNYKYLPYIVVDFKELPKEIIQSNISVDIIILEKMQTLNFVNKSINGYYK